MPRPDRAAPIRLALSFVVLFCASCGAPGSGLSAGPTTLPGTTGGDDVGGASAADRALAAVPRHVLFVMADGAGPAHLAYARAVRLAAGAADLVLMGQIAPVAVSGTVETSCLGGGVTDSAAAATALATGRKTVNALCAIGPDGERYPTILEVLAPLGWRRAIVTDAAVVDASPAAFAAHATRRSFADIALELAGQRLDILFGNGARYFLPVAGGGARKDGRDLVTELRAGGVDVVTDAALLSSLRRLPAAALVDTTYGPGPASAASLLEHALALLATPALPPGDAPPLAAAHVDPPFFIFAETEAVDTAAHHGDAEEVVTGVVAYDDLAAAALRFYRSHADHTLLLLTSDHETGGFTVTDGVPTFSTSGHTSTPVFLYALGAGAERFAGALDNTDVGIRLFELLTGAGPPAPVAGAEPL